MNGDDIIADWIAADWGTTRLRVWAMSAENKVLAAADSVAGFAALEGGRFEEAFLALASPWLATGRVTEVLVCGMAGARGGWAEAGYSEVPCPAFGADAVMPKVNDPHIRVRVLGGVSQAKPPDVMRGEETQIAGVLADRPDFSGVIVLPGTHTKWVEVKDGEIFHFATFMTGEIFSLLAKESVISRVVAGPEAPFDSAVFATAVEDALARPERVASALFSVRAASLLDDGITPEAARARLSGLLIGAELAGARPYWLGQEIILAGNGTLCGLYQNALGLVGVTAEEMDGDTVVLAGLTAARTALNTKMEPSCAT